MTLSAEYNVTDSWSEHAVAVKGVRKVPEENFKMILMGGRHHCRTVRHAKAEGGHDWP